MSTTVVLPSTAHLRPRLRAAATAGRDYTVAVRRTAWGQPRVVLTTQPTPAGPTPVEEH